MQKTISATFELVSLFLTIFVIYFYLTSVVFSVSLISFLQVYIRLPEEIYYGRDRRGCGGGGARGVLVVVGGSVSTEEPGGGGGRGRTDLCRGAGIPSR